MHLVNTELMGAGEGAVLTFANTVTVMIYPMTIRFEAGDHMFDKC